MAKQAKKSGKLKKGTKLEASKLQRGTLKRGGVLLNRNIKLARSR